ncbi:MAG: DUF2726 domain-containing protein [Nevskia sp.]|nr:DUF2726 domain-containing protein [Nevskia sp.]
MKIALGGVALLLVLAVLAVIAARKRPQGEGPAPNYRRKDFLSKAERSFFGVLQQAVDREGLIFAKVRLADLLTPAAGPADGGWQSAFNRIQSKHVDFILCSLGDLTPKLAIELDDASHRQARRKERDQFLETACQSAGLPLLRVPAHRDYAVRQLREQIAPFLGFPPDKHPTMELPAMPQPPAPVERSGTEAPACPKCGAPMVRREGKSGVLAGKAFWGCSTFPQCRGLA